MAAIPHWRSLIPRCCSLFELRTLAGDRVEHLGVAGLLELLQGLPAHRRIDVQIRGAHHRGQLLEEKEDHTVMDERAPVAPAYQIALLGGKPCLSEHRLR